MGECTTKTKENNNYSTSKTRKRDFTGRRINHDLLVLVNEVVMYDKKLMVGIFNVSLLKDVKLFPEENAGKVYIISRNKKCGS